MGAAGKNCGKVVIERLPPDPSTTLEGMTGKIRITIHDHAPDPAPIKGIYEQHFNEEQTSYEESLFSLCSFLFEHMDDADIWDDEDDDADGTPDDDGYYPDGLSSD